MKLAFEMGKGGKRGRGKSVFKDAGGLFGHIVPLAARFRFTKNAADAKLVKDLAKHWSFFESRRRSYSAWSRLLS